MKKASVLVSLSGLLMFAACGPTAPTGTGGAGGTGGTAPFAVTSPAFAEGQPIPGKYQCTLITGGTNFSPALNWTPGPAGTKSYAVVLRDKDVNITHWVIWDIPASALGLPEHVDGVLEPAIPAGSKQVVMNASITGYFGPCSPTSVNTYEFSVYAIPTETISGISTASTAAQAVQGIGDAATESVTLSGES